MSLTDTVTTLAHDIAHDASHVADDLRKQAVALGRKVDLPSISLPDSISNLSLPDALSHLPFVSSPEPAPRRSGRGWIVALLLALVIGGVVFAKRRRASSSAVHEPTSRDSRAVEDRAKHEAA